MAEFVLQLQDIDDTGKGYTFELTPEWLDAALADSPVRRDPSASSGWLRVHAQRNGQELLVQGHVEVELLTECARCLGDAPLPVQTELTALLCPGDDAGVSDELEQDAEELDRVPFVGHEVALDELIREHLLLECPMQPLCSTQCPGIPIPEHVRPRAEDFGDGTGVDPRLLPLKQLRQKLSGNQE